MKFDKMFTFAFLDLEMTGLNVNKDRILETALVISDSQLNKTLEGPCRVIHQDESVLQNMNEWCIQHHGQSGLTQAVRESRFELAEVESELLEFLTQHMVAGEAILCGNSIHTDRRFLSQYMPKIDEFFHYRMLDVSVFKIVSEHWYDQFPVMEKKNNHRAVDDIYESINELKHYRKHLLNL